MKVVDGLITTNKAEPHDEWQTDENGRRFRMMGNVKEYEMMIRIDGIEIPQSQLSAYNERKKKLKEQQPKEKPVYFTGKVCPFKMGRNSMRTACNRECAFFDNGCIIAKTERKPPRETKGAYCPITRTCKDSCALYNNGCTLTAIVRALIEYF